MPRDELLWWVMFAAAAVVFLGAVALLGTSWLRRDARELRVVGQHESVAEAMVLVFGIAVPIVVLAALFGASSIYRIGQAPPPRPTRVWRSSFTGRSVTNANAELERDRDRELAGGSSASLPGRAGSWRGGSLTGHRPPGAAHDQS